MNPLWEYDMSLKGDKYDYICGIDEVGRGSLAGSICASAVILTAEAQNFNIKDSKKLSQKTREDLFDKIINNCIYYNIQSLSANYIDEYGIQKANREVLRRSRENIILKFPKNVKILTIADGNPLWIDNDLLWVQKADNKSLSSAAASILSKVYRDKIMIYLGDQYPDYMFHQHKGYGTSIHQEAIKKYGKINRIHRETFLRKMLGQD